MFNLIVKYNAWSNGRDEFPISRILEFTESGLASSFKEDGILLVEKLIKLPTLFLEETSGREDQLARVGQINRARINRDDLAIEFSYDQSIPPILNSHLELMKADLGIHDFEFTRTHWAVKDFDLYKSLLVNAKPVRSSPKVFSLPQHEVIEPTLVSAMMPFEMSFNAVYEALKETSRLAGLRCRRADDIWENPAVIQDVVSLIDKSRVVIADCTHRNPNVFYEIGIAHTLGREVILITQNESDVPFDLRHLRYIKYLNNQEGLAKLSEVIQARLEAITR
ncbi:MAG: hypothetical protein ACOYB0_10335 [Polynucleobacter sp.]